MADSVAEVPGQLTEPIEVHFLTERLAQILPGERLEVEVVVPGPRAQFVQEALVANNQRAAPEGVVTEGQRRVVEYAHVDRAL